MSMTCADFADACLNHGIGMSREDLKFMNTVESSFIQCEEGHDEVCLALPANTCQAERRALSLKVNTSRTRDFKKTMLHSRKRNPRRFR